MSALDDAIARLREGQMIDAKVAGRIADIVEDAVNELAEALRELEPAALRLAQLTNLAHKAGASVAEWDATRQAIDKARVKARRALAKLPPPSKLGTESARQEAS